MPLDQFWVIRIIISVDDFLIKNFGNKVIIILTNLTIFLIGIVCLNYSINCIIVHRKRFFQMIENIGIFMSDYYPLIITMIQENISGRFPSFISYIFFLLTSLLLANLIGLIPNAFALTSHADITLFLSFSTFIITTSTGFQRNGLPVSILLLPPGPPFPLSPFLILIELISYLARLFSLAIRSFANIMSGHISLKILAQFTWNFIEAITLIVISPLIIIVSVSSLEFAIAILQAYVFTILTCIYLNEMINLH